MSNWLILLILLLIYLMIYDNTMSPPTFLPKIVLQVLIQNRKEDTQRFDIETTCKMDKE